MNKLTATAVVLNIVDYNTKYRKNVGFLVIMCYLLRNILYIQVKTPGFLLGNYTLYYVIYHFYII